MGITTPEPGIYKEPNSVWGKLWILIFIILFTTRLLTKTTLTDYYTYAEVFWYFFITIFSFIYLFYVILIRKTLDEMNYLYVMMLTLPVLSAVAANIAEGQSIPGGLIAQRHWFGLGGIFLIIFLLRTHFFTIKDLFRAMEWLGWLCLFFYLYCYVFLDAEKYAEYSFVGYSDLKGGYRFRFGVDFISFLALYYMIKFIVEKKQMYVWLAIIQLAYLFFLHQGRIVMLSVVAGIFLYYLIEVNWKRTLIYSFVGGTLFLVFMTILTFAFPEFAGRYLEQYTNVVLVFLGEDTGEGSVEARVEETAIVLIYLASYPIGWVIGVGKYGADYNDPDKPITTIAPGDIGILGSIITYGILGTLIMYIQFFIAFRSMKFVKTYRKNVYYITAVYFLFYCFATSLAKGNLFTQPGSTAIFILVIYAFKLWEVQESKKEIVTKKIAAT
ncbi:MAG: hypothetical protein KA954_01755 [Chitinophagales bacterium]|nr:hypothetical protein [Bacteroidota bacterium]MBP7398280.1 hypothetical protein [Chitinophagales bacterium]MBK8488950.1 hypothetical protein [Bacteroidota bacterium]MBK8680797.1 hypothetical protein [Bacteroidota bacterium]MBP8753604.1 hypothetical protein [Chitinophagales bacterium]